MLQLPYDPDSCEQGRKRNHKWNHWKQVLLCAEARRDTRRMQKAKNCLVILGDTKDNHASWGPNDNLGICVVGFFQPLVSE